MKKLTTQLFLLAVWAYGLLALAGSGTSAGGSGGG
jgi:hypothetical protein